MFSKLILSFFLIRLEIKKNTVPSLTENLPLFNIWQPRSSYLTKMRLRDYFKNEQLELKIQKVTGIQENFQKKNNFSLTKKNVNLIYNISRCTNNLHLLDKGVI